MTQEIVFGLVRHILTTGGGVLVAKGMTTDAGVEAAAGAVVALAGFIWSIIHKTQTPAK